MAWLKIDAGLYDNPKTIALAHDLRQDINRTVSLLLRFWLKSLVFSPSGDITDLRADVAADMLSVPFPFYRRFHKSMMSNGFLDVRNNRILIHDWLDYTGRYLKDSLFKRSPEKWEEVLRLHGQSADCPQTVGGQSAECQRPDEMRLENNNNIKSEEGKKADADVKNNRVRGAKRRRYVAFTD